MPVPSRKWNEIQAEWSEFSSALLARWNELTRSDLREVVGHRDRLVAKIRERYGVTAAEAERQIDDWLKGR